MKRERWPSRAMFVFAAVGSAVGLGNLWRFPFLVGKYGGGAFLLPYMIMLFLVGFPLLVLEFALGQKMQKGAIGAFRKVNKKFRGLGLGAVLSAFGVSSYYAVIMAWSVLYVLYSFSLEWGADTKTFFFSQVLEASEGPQTVGGFSTHIVLALVATWVMVYFCIWKGLKSVSAVIKVTMPLPIILLFLLLAKTIFLPGAMEGLAFYLQPNFSALLDLEVWMAAVAQVFFTLTLGFGVMITYGSYEDSDSDIVVNSLIIAISDVFIAFLAGLVIFATIGYMANVSDQSISELAASGPSLAFIVFPHALSLIPGSVFLSIMFFVTLISLGIDSIFSLIEAVATIFYDTFPHISKKIVVFYLCFVGILSGLIFTTSAGIYYIDLIDHYVTVYGLVLVGLLQTIVIGWYYGPDKLRKYFNSVSDIKLGKWWNALIKYWIPLSLFSILATTFYQDITNLYEGYPLWVQLSFGWGLIGVIIISSLAYSLFHVRSSEDEA